MSLKISQEAKPARPGWFSWRVWLDGSEDDLAAIESVEYTLHPSFPEHIRRIADRNSKFELVSEGWGEFMIYADVHSKSGSSVALRHWLRLQTFFDPARRALFLAGSKQDELFTDAVQERLELAGYRVNRIGGEDAIGQADACVLVLSGAENPWFDQELQRIRAAEKVLLVIALADIDLPQCFASYRCRDSKTIYATVSWLQGMVDRPKLEFSPSKLPSASSAFWDRRLSMAEADLRLASECVFPLVSGKTIVSIAVAISPDWVLAPVSGSLPPVLEIRTAAGDIPVMGSSEAKGFKPYRVVPPLASYVRLASSLPSDPALAAISFDADGVLSLVPGWITKRSETGFDHNSISGTANAVLISLESGEMVGLQAGDSPGSMAPAIIRDLAGSLGIALPAGATALESFADDFLERAQVSDYADRKGYHPEFLGNTVPLPSASGSVIDLKYTNFTVGLSPSRRLALYTAVNINGRVLKAITRSDDRWLLDPRVPDNQQIGGSFYRGTPLDRGHMVRRLDPVWGPQAKKAELDTFHYSNSCPQHRDLNRKTWNDLEDYIYDNTGREDLKICVFTGPVLREDDPPFHGAKLPEEFWKVVVMRRDDGRLSATGYLLSQQDMIQGLEFVFGQFRTYQVPIALIEKKTKLDFGELRRFDPKLKAGSLESASAASEVHGPRDLELGAMVVKIATRTIQESRAPSAWVEIGKSEDRLFDALNTFDWTAVGELTSDLVRQMGRNPAAFNPAFAQRILGRLRRKRRFGEMTTLADSFIRCGINAPQVRRQYAQALIDQGDFYPAELILRAIVSDAGAPDSERDEAQGLLGRTFKQIYVNAETPRNPAHLRAALNAYWLTYEVDPEKIWHGINVVAILMRAGRDGVKLDSAIAPHKVAKEILQTVAKKETESETGDLEPFDVATAMEAYLALGDYDRLAEYAGRYTTDQRADAFEIASTLRQFEEVWQLQDDQPPGDQVLPALRSALLNRAGGAVRLSAGSNDLQKVFGSDKSVGLDWYRTGLLRAHSIARIETNGKGFGTGWLIRAADLGLGGPDRLLLLTNAHVIGPNTPDRYSEALRPEDASVHFQIQEHRTSGKVIFHSPVNKCDATLLELSSLPVGAAALPVDSADMVVANPAQRLYIIGHPGGRDLEFALQDNHLLAVNQRLVHYRTPSEGGSSGSPVFGPADWKVVALHHAGSAQMPRIDGKPGTYEANEGIAMGALRKAVGAGA